MSAISLSCVKCQKKPTQRQEEPNSVGWVALVGPARPAMSARGSGHRRRLHHPQQPCSAHIRFLKSVARFLKLPIVFQSHRKDAGKRRRPSKSKAFAKGQRLRPPSTVTCLGQRENSRPAEQLVARSLTFEREDEITCWCVSRDSRGPWRADDCAQYLSRRPLLLLQSTRDTSVECRVFWIGRDSRHQRAVPVVRSTFTSSR
jgi:hypothetical protein